MPRSFVSGCAGLALSGDELSFFRDSDPFGLILFRRNVGDPDQLRRLTGDFRDAVGWDAPVLVDQEGGRVQRLTEPHWRKYPSATRLSRAVEVCGDTGLYRDVARLMAEDLRAVGITVDCAPCLDLGLPGQSAAIGDRALGSRPEEVARAGRAIAEGLLDGGVLPVVKHMPGHGRATVDSHYELPVVAASIDDLVANDFVPFVALSDVPAAMTAHIVFTAIDPDRPATQSETVVREIIRGLIGFDGLLLSDDLSMNALKGTLGERAAASLAAGCDVALHCNGLLAEMEQVAAASPNLAGKALERADAALSRIGAGDRVDEDDVLARLSSALAACDSAAGI